MENLRRKTSKTAYGIAVNACFFGLFILGTVLRPIIYGGTFLKNFSPVFFIGAAFICRYCKKQNRNITALYNKMGTVLYLIIIVISIIIFVFNKSINRYISFIVIDFIPIIIIYTTITDRRKFEYTFQCWIKYTKFCVIVMLSCEIIDVLSGYYVSRLIARISRMASLFLQVSDNRSVTYMGHPLYSGEIFLSLYIFTHLWNKYKGKKDTLVDFIIPFIGVLFSQSKLLFAVIVFAFIFYNFHWKKAVYVLGIFGAILVLYRFGIFDGLINRVRLSLASGDITSGRYKQYISLFSNGNFKFYWFKTQNLALYTSTRDLQIALEYPFLRWAFAFGIFMSILLTITIFIIPIAHLIIRKHYELAISLLIIVVQVSSYSGVADVGNKALHYYIIVFLISSYSNMLYDPLVRRIKLK